MTLWRLWRLASVSYCGWEHVRKLEAEREPWYIVLGVRKNATYAEALHRFRELCKLHHPDLDTMPEANEKFMKIADAFEEPRAKARQNRFARFRAQPA